MNLQNFIELMHRIDFSYLTDDELRIVFTKIKKIESNAVAQVLNFRNFEEALKKVSSLWLK